MVPDCGYQLRRIEVEAIGQLDAQRFTFDGNGQSVVLKDSFGSQGRGRVFGHFGAPIAVIPVFEIDKFVAQ